MKAKAFDEKFDQDESDITDHLDLSKARRARRERERLNVELPERSTIVTLAANIQENLEIIGRSAACAIRCNRSSSASPTARQP